MGRQSESSYRDGERRQARHSKTRATAAVTHARRSLRQSSSDPLPANKAPLESRQPPRHRLKKLQTDRAPSSPTARSGTFAHYREISKVCRIYSSVINILRCLRENLTRPLRRSVLVCLCVLSCSLLKKILHSNSLRVSVVFNVVCGSPVHKSTKIKKSKYMNLPGDPRNVFVFNS